LDREERHSMGKEMEPKGGEDGVSSGKSDLKENRSRFLSHDISPV